MTNGGAPDSFGDFYAAEFNGLLRFMFKHGADWHDAFDACQDAFLEALPRWQAIDNPRAWVRTTAYRAYLKRRARFAEDERRMSRADWAPRPAFDKLEIPEEEARVLRLFASLPPRQRQVLAWHYDGYSNIEIAKILGLTDKAVAANLYQARQGLKRLLSENGEDGSAGGAR